jgi:hypothetical protein
MFPDSGRQSDSMRAIYCGKPRSAGQESRGVDFGHLFLAAGLDSVAPFSSG